MANSFTTPVPDGIVNLTTGKQVLRGLDLDITAATAIADESAHTFNDADLFIFNDGGTASQAATKKISWQYLKAQMDPGVDTLGELTDFSYGDSPAAGDLMLLSSGTAATSVTMSGDATLSSTGALTLSTTVNSDTTAVGSGTVIPVITANNKGLVTSIGTANVASTLNIAGDAGTSNGIEMLTETLTVTGAADSINSTVVDNGTITLDLDASVHIDTAIKGSGSASAKALWTDDAHAITIGNASGSVTMEAPVTFNGTSTTVASTDFTLDDNHVAYGTANSGTEWGGASATSQASLLFATSNNAESSSDVLKRQSIKLVSDGDGFTSGEATTHAMLSVTHASHQTLATEIAQADLGLYAPIKAGAFVFDDTAGSLMYGDGVHSGTPTDGQMVFSGDNLYIYVA